MDLGGASHIIEALRPIWKSKAKTAVDVHQRIESVMAWAVAWGYIANNPTPDTKTIKAALGSHKRTVKHHRSLSHDQVSSAIESVRSDPKTEEATRLAIKFLVLTAAPIG